MQSDALPVLLTRQSVGARHLVEPGPDDAALRLMCEAALRAPDHGALVPFRFAVVRGAARAQLAALFEQAARDAGKGDADARIDAERAQRAPLTLAVLARIDLGHTLVPAHEQWACVGGALTNLLNAAHALGFGGKMLSGAKVRSPVLQRAFCEAGETLVGWVALGTPAASPARQPRKLAADAVLREWSGPRTP
ncbi:MAG: nitroreductase [Burkholderiaceae bacterium]|nr:MAG: nitroreductase [Burkholderiaceae bacterium]MBE7426565.1 nitroreductase [Ideonella sp.]MCC7288424.1 nitroreductase [Burkholderiaceae bacterium]